MAILEPPGSAHRRQIERAARAKEEALDMDIVDRRLGEASTLGSGLLAPGQSRNPMASKATVESAAGQLGMVSRRPPSTSSSASKVRRRNATTIASSISVRTVLFGLLGLIGWSTVVVRLRHFATVFAFRP